MLAFLCKLLPGVCLPERVARNRKYRRNDLRPSRFLMLVTRSKQCTEKDKEEKTIHLKGMERGLST